MKSKRIISLALSIIMIATCLVGCGKSIKQEKITIDDKGFTVTFDSYDKDGRAGECLIIDLHTKEQEKFIINDDNIKKHAKGKDAKDKSNSVEYKGTTDFVLYLSENDDFSNPIVISSNNKKATIDNLKIGTIYFVKAIINNEEIELSPLSTADHGPRIMNVDGVKNVRDIGGWTIDENTRVRQGMIYRCARLNESDIDHEVVEISEEGIKTMVYDMGIKTEIDLRVGENNETGTISSSPLGSTVKYYNFPMSYENDFYLDSKDMVRDVFKLMAYSKNYPIIFHCNIGTDRTGMIAYILNSLLGVDNEQLYTDYLFSNFADIGGSRSLDNLRNASYYKEMRDQDGETNSEKAYNLLLSLGLTKNEIESIKSIMTEQR